MDTSPSRISQGKSVLATKSCSNFWLLQATQTLMKMHLVSACHSSSLVPNQRHMRLQNTAGLCRPRVISTALEILCTHKLTAQQQDYCFQFDDYKHYIAHLHFPSSTTSYCASKAPVQDKAGCCCQNNYSAQSNLASAPRHGNRRVCSSSELLTICSNGHFLIALWSLPVYMQRCGFARGT